MTRDELALALWQESIDHGLCPPGERATQAQLPDWWANRSEDAETYDRAAAGDVTALVAVRRDSGLPALV